MKNIIFICLFLAAVSAAAQNLATPNSGVPLAQTGANNDYLTATAGVKNGQQGKYVYDTSLMRAVKAQDADSVQTLLRAHVDPNEKNYEGLAPLYKAAELGNLAIVKLLVEAGAKPKINEPGNFGITPLMAASAGGHADVVKYLLENGADVTMRDELNKTAILHAGAGGTPLTFKYLLQADANMEDTDKYGETPLVIALKAKNDAGAADLISRGANLSATSVDGMTAQVLANAYGAKTLTKKALDKRLKQEGKGTFNPRTEPVIIQSRGSSSSSAARPVSGTPVKPVVYGNSGVNMQTNTDTQNAPVPAPDLIIEHK
ncbi:MAG: ankyrin repeat domain-containing protein [Elusimicrobia bacterium]|nr:ankyrin repeat domain-containing protein [Elusimicrobiota bacterium]